MPTERLVNLTTTRERQCNYDLCHVSDAKRFGFNGTNFPIGVENNCNFIDLFPPGKRSITK